MPKEDDLIVENVNVETIELKPEFTSDEDMLKHRQKEHGICPLCDKPAKHWLFTANKHGLTYNTAEVYGFCRKHYNEILEHINSRIRKRCERKEAWRFWQRSNK